MKIGGWRSAAPGLRVSERRGGAPVQVRFAGELDMATAAVAARIVMEAAARSCTVELDLTYVTFFDAYAYGRLLEAQAALQARNAELVLIGAHRTVRRVLTVLGTEGLRAVPDVMAARTSGLEPTAAAVLEQTVDRAVGRCGADMANAQVLDARSQTLRIAAQCGFSRRFLDFFEVVERADTACGASMVQRRPVWVSDVASSPIFAETPARDAVLDAGVRAVASIPVLTPAGELVAVFSVHRRQIGDWPEAQRRQLEQLSRATGEQLVRT